MINKIKNILIGRLLIFSIFIIILNYGCEKQNNWLNAKSSKSLSTPSTLDDYQAMLNESSDVMNVNGSTLGLIGTDNLYIPDNNLGNLTPYEVQIYQWQEILFTSSDGTITEWNSPFQIIEYANIVLDGIQSIDISSNNQAQYNRIKGEALFFRAFAYYELANLFCKPFINSSASTDLGLALRLSSDVNIRSIRATVKQTYEQMISDLSTAVLLLPESPANLMRPSQSAANALLAKIYLNMGDYTNTEKYATAVLQKTSALMDFNAISPSLSRPFPNYSSSLPSLNPEMILWNKGSGYESICARCGDGLVDSVLFNSYDSNDLRKVILFQPGNGGQVFKGSYVGSSNFTGLATNEIYLIRAEAAARLGNVLGAMTDINNLLTKRYVSGKFTPLSITDPNSALLTILNERRKELPFTGQIRWEDLRRLNQDSKFAITLKRTSKGVIYTLPPNDPRYVFSIPDYEIQVSGIQQNER